ncbi:MAG TPA: protein kinase [Luteimonas sp.]|nr:protein kinase [Luteimonas sp.]
MSAGPNEHAPRRELAALASLAFGHASVAAEPAPGTTRHLAFLSLEALELDLSDPEQRDFGDYELLEQLGAGGMGVVYRARQKSLDREVAVKLLSAGPWASNDFIERFRREAQSAARLQHPNIVAIHEIGSHDELNYFSMALVRGPNLAQNLADNGPMQPRQAAALVRTVAEALHYAHRLGVLHLDLKPGNVLIDPQGEPQVADFGLARRIDSTLATDATEVSGTPSYMAPEQIELRRHKLSVATDIYGLGAILYELLTGQPPFDAASPQEILALVLGGRLRHPRRYRPDLPRDLEAICLKCLAKEPAERYPNAQALADDLGRFLEGRAVSVRPLNMLQRLQRWMRREPRLAGAISLGVLALLVGLGATLVQRERAEESAASSREQTWRTRADAAWRLVAEGRTVDAAPLIVDNLREREAHGDADGVVLERLRLGTLQQTGAQLIDAIATGGVGRAVDVNRAGDRVAVVDTDEIVRLYAVDDGRQLWQASTAEHTHFRGSGMPPSRVEFSADGRYLMTTTVEPPSFMSPSGRNNVLIDASSGAVIVPSPEVFADFFDATYGADGRYALLRSRHGQAQFFRVDGWRPQMPPQPVPSVGGSWLVGDGGRFIARSSQHRIELLDTASLQPRFSHQFGQADGPKHWAAQPDGDLLALGHVDGSVRLLDSRRLSMHELRPAPSNPISSLSFSHDGSWLLAGAGGRVFLWDTASGHGGELPSQRPIEATRLQADAASATVFAAAPNDAKLWHVPELPGGDFRTRVAGARTPVTQFGLGQSLPRNAAAYAPSANLVANVTRNGELRLWRWRDGRPMQARSPTHLADELHFDGRHVVAVDGNVVRIVTIEGEQEAAPALVHPQPVSFATFAADGDTLVTVSGRELRVFDWRTGQPLFAPIVLDDSPQRVAISPDSRHLFTATGGYRDDRHIVLGSMFDLRSGQPLARDLPLPAPLAGLRFSRNGRHLVHWRYGELQARDVATLRALGEPLRVGGDMAAARDAGQAQPIGHLFPGEAPVVDAAISDDGTRVTLIVRGQEPDTPRLLQLDTGSGSVLQSRTLGASTNTRLWPHGDAYHFSIWHNISGIAQWIDSASGVRSLPYAGGTMYHAQAISHDGRWLATTSSNGVMLADRDGSEWATPALNVQLPPDDHIVQLGFSTDTSALLARSDLGHWLWWPLSPDARSIAQIERRMAHLHPDPAAGRAPIATALPEEERRQLHAGDPGIHVPADTPPAAASPPTLTGQAASGFAFVDLRPAYNRRIDRFVPYIGSLTQIPLGHQRMLGIDFDVAGVVKLSMPEAPSAATGSPAASASLPSPRPRLAAVHVLIGGCCPMPGNPRGPYAYLALHYADGTRARIPILHSQDMWFFGMDPGDSGSARIAWVFVPPGDLPYSLYAPRLANPHPDRDVTAITFEASEHFASGPLILAATAELAGDAVDMRTTAVEPP